MKIIGALLILAVCGSSQPASSTVTADTVDARADEIAPPPTEHAALQARFADNARLRLAEADARIADRRASAAPIEPATERLRTLAAARIDRCDQRLSPAQWLEQRDSVVTALQALARQLDRSTGRAG